MAAAGAGLLLALLPVVLAHPAAALALVPAQAGFALAWGWLRGTRRGPDGATRWLRDAAALLLLWGGGACTLGAVAAWPAGALADGGRLSAALALSAVAGLALVALWRLWPAFTRASREGGGLATLLEAVGETDPASFRGLAAATAVLVVLALVDLLAWPATTAWRLPLALAHLVLAPLAHGLVHRTGAAPAQPAAVAPPEADAEPAPAPTAAAMADPDAELYPAARAGRIERALDALAAGADPHALPAEDERDQRTLAMLAALHADLRLLRELIARGIEVDRRHGGLTALLVATRDSWHGRPEAVTTLLANGADPRLTDAHGQTPLHHAARSSDPGVAALLLDAGAPLDALDADGASPLAAACAAGSWRLARFLLERGARPEPVGGRPALLGAAAGDDDAAGVALLLRHRARVDAADRDARTALMAACAAGNLDIVDALLDAGAGVDRRDAAGRTALMEAVGCGRIEVLERLLRAQPDPDAADAGGRTALIHAVDRGAGPDVLRRLLEHGADPALADAQGRRAIEHALASGRWHQVAVLDPGFPLPASLADAALPDARAPELLIDEALAAGRFDLASSLLEAQPPSARVDLLSGLLPAFAGEGDPARLDWLLARGADPERPLEDGDDALFRLLGRGGAAAPGIQRLLDAGAAPAGRGGLMRYLAACFEQEHVARGYEQLALALLERGADPFGGAGDPPLSLAVRLGWLRLAEALLQAGAWTEARDGAGMTALHLACGLGRGAAVRLLVRYGASPQAVAPDGQSPLGIALTDSRRDLAVWLEWRDWPLPPRPLRGDDVPAAAMAGDAGAVERLLDLGFAVDATDAQGCTALLRAAGGGQLALVERLLARGADPAHAARTGATPLSAALTAGHAAVVERLLAHGARVDQRLPAGVTPLMLAAALGQPDMVGRLLAHQADLHARDERGQTALHVAMLYAFGAGQRARVLALFDTLLLAGADAGAAADEGHTPLLLLLGSRAEPDAPHDEEVLLAALERLLEEDGVDLDAREGRGFGPLHVAALHGLRGVAQRLLRAGADRAARDALGRTPYEIAIQRGFVDVAAEFEPVRSSVSLARFLRTPER
nr:ankyrin repeat domain-containing protein [Coralloluteibacterium stylophorae]